MFLNLNFCRYYNEKKFTKMEEKRPDEMEMAEEENEKREKKEKEDKSIIIINLVFLF